jgi:hypothetical protein
MRGVTIKTDITAQVLKSLQSMTKKQCLVGIPAANADREPEPGEKTEVNNALIGYVMENGSPAQNIPARPHLVPGVESIEPEIAARYRAGAIAVLDGRASSLDDTHTAVGLIAVAAVQRKIDDGPYVPLAPRTLQRRRARGRTGEKPLIDSGQYRRAQNFVIRDKGQ